MTTSAPVVFAGIASALVIAAIGVAVAIIGPPWEVRLQRLDEQRVRDLQAIAAAVEGYRRTHDRIPASLHELQQRDPTAVLRVEDAATGEAYEYRVKDTSTYALCARFDAASRPDPWTSPFWDHGPGRQCFDLEATLPVRR